ncbi:hypothetical protein ACFCV9_22365 [Streptomyces sp. NPDC056367]
MFVSRRRPDIRSGRVLTYDPQIDELLGTLKDAGATAVTSAEELTA